MAKQSTDTKSEIIEAARTEFFTHGYEGARLQKIADQIGVTKAMIHYYFNTKKELFEHVYIDSARDIFGGLNKIIEQDISLFQKIEQLVETCIDKSETHPQVLAFVITESNRKPDWLQPIFQEQVELELRAFNSELEEAASNYEIASVDARNLLLNIFSLCYYPVLSSTINNALLQPNSTNGTETKQASRKGIILDTILNWLTA